MQLEFYKKGQGYYTRMCTALAGAFMAALGCYALYQAMDGIQTGDVITSNLKEWIRVGTVVVLFAAISFGLYRLVNMPRFADFLIATEGEMKKVSWSSRKEIIASTRVVVITVILLACLLAIVDTAFRWIFQSVGVLKI